MKFDELLSLSRKLGPREFLATYPRPALLLEPFSAARSGIDTPSRGTPTFRSGESSTEILAADVAAAIMDSLGKAVDPDAQVGWLVKSDRNPFGALLTVGRARNNDVIVEHPTISKVHAIFTCDAAGWSVADHGSTNGTFLNGVRLPDRWKRDVQDGDSVRLGQEIMARFFGADALLNLCTMLRTQRR